MWRNDEEEDAPNRLASAFSLVVCGALGLRSAWRSSTSSPSSSCVERSLTGVEAMADGTRSETGVPFFPSPFRTAATSFAIPTPTTLPPELRLRRSVLLPLTFLCE